RGQAAGPGRRQLGRVEAAARVTAADLIEIPFAAAGAGRVLVLVERRDFVLAVRLRRHLRELLIALAVVVERHEIRTERRQELQVERQPADADAEIRIPVRTEGPDLVLLDRAAKGSIPLVDRLAGRRAAGRDAVLRVVAVPVHFR